MAREVRMFDRTLLEAIKEGVVPRPGLLTYQDWNSWRAREGQRPSKRRHGDDARTTATGDEAQLWRTVIKGLVRPGIERPVGYGWGCLARARGRRREGSREGHRKAGFDRPNGEPPATGPARSVASSTVGGESVFRDMSLVRLQEVFLKDTLLGPKRQSLLKKACDGCRRPSVCSEKRYRRSLGGAAGHPRPLLEQEHERRVSILLEMIQEKGGQLSKAAQKLFSSSEGTPEKGLNLKGAVQPPRRESLGGSSCGQTSRRGQVKRTEKDISAQPRWSRN